MKGDLFDMAMTPAQRELHIQRLDAVMEAGGMCMQQDDGYKCTLPRLHTGQHEAHGVFEETVHVWCGDGK